MSERFTDEQLRDVERLSRNPLFRDIVTELLALRAAWKIAEPHLPEQVYRRALAALSGAPQ